MTMPPVPPPASSEPAAEWPTQGPADGGSPPPAGGSGGSGGADGPNYAQRRLIVIGGIVVAVLVVIGIIVLATRGDDTKKNAATTTTLGARNLNPTPGAVEQLKFEPFESKDPVFTIQAAGGARRDSASQTPRFLPAGGTSATWSLDVRPPAKAGVDLKTAAQIVIGNPATTPLADTGTVGPHLDEMITTGQGDVMVHIASGKNNLFVLMVPKLSGGSALNGKAIFNQMSGSLHAPGVGATN